jgi:hypothetical protein
LRDSVTCGHTVSIARGIAPPTALPTTPAISAAAKNVLNRCVRSRGVECSERNGAAAIWKNDWPTPTMKPVASSVGPCAVVARRMWPTPSSTAPSMRLRRRPQRSARMPAGIAATATPIAFMDTARPTKLSGKPASTR